MPRDVQAPTVDERGDERHPAFGRVQVTRPQHSPPGHVLFDSDIRHQHYVSLRISQATRKRDINRDWIHESGQIIEICMSESQWAQMVSSIGSTGTSCTIQYVNQGQLERGHQPGLELESRLALSAEETGEAAERAFQAIKDAMAKYEEKKSIANLRSLHFAIENAPKNVEYAAESLTEHTEMVVQKARADIEAMIDARAREVGIDPLLAVQSMPMLEASDE